VRAGRVTGDGTDRNPGGGADIAGASVDGGSREGKSRPEKGRTLAGPRGNYGVGNSSRDPQSEGIGGNCRPELARGSK